MCHRRAGKTVATLNDLIRGAVNECKPEGRYAFIFPQRNQAKDTAWRYLRRYAEPLLAKPPNESELRVDLVNGSMTRLYGADNPDALRGPYLDGVVLDEFADMKPGCPLGNNTPGYVPQHVGMNGKCEFRATPALATIR